MKAFHAYDIRGIYNEDFNKEDVYRIGYFLPMLLETDKILVGRDARVSSPEIFEALCNGIIDCGASVYNAGLTTTPMTYFLTATHKFEASVMITASHNTREYNGLKVSKKNALPVGFDNGLGELKRMMEEEQIVPALVKGKVYSLNVKAEYAWFLKKFHSDFSNLKLAVDCSNGMAGLFAKDLFGKSPLLINDKIDCSFPNHDPNPLELKNLVELKELVLNEACDLGVIFDGDADRCAFVDEKGRFISPDLMIALMGHFFLEDKPEGTKVLIDIRSSKGVVEYLQKKFKADVHVWRVGRAYAALKLRELDGLYGGELAGHYYFKDFFFSDSGLIAALIIIQVASKMKKAGISLSQIIDEIGIYQNSGEINFKLDKKQEAMDAVKSQYEKCENLQHIYDFDGYRLDFKDWWFNIRKSNTEPYLRLIVEANRAELLAEKLEEIKKIITSFAAE